MTTGRIEVGPTGRTVAANVKRLREARGLTLRGLSAALKECGRPLSADAVNKIENGAANPDRGVRRVDVDDLMALAIVLNVNPSALLLPPDDSSATLVELFPGRHSDGGEVRATASRVWNWADGAEPLFGHPDATRERQVWMDFIQSARPPRRGPREMEHAMRAFRLSDEERDANGQSVD
ncbi:helix-turn-helix domain-containing protein [Streptomyces globisporus]